MEYGNGIVGDMCVHMLDMVRWMMDLPAPKSVYSDGGILVDKKSKANISDTQTATFDYDNLKIVWTHRTWGSPPDPKYPWSLTLHGDITDNTTIVTQTLNTPLILDATRNITAAEVLAVSGGSLTVSGTTTASALNGGLVLSGGTTTFLSPAVAVGSNRYGMSPELMA